MYYQPFDNITTPLQTGINLIEASAGTGKTYAIAMLVLRFVVEQGVSINALLLVTFTKAATEELKARVRLRLTEARQVFAGHTEGVDSNIIRWVEQLDIEHSVAKQRLQLALLDIDQAGIFTIHGFCQRVLKEHALETGQLFDSELSSDIRAIRQACADDFWRQQVYQRTVDEAGILISLIATPDDLLASIQGITPGICVYPDLLDIDELLNRVIKNVFAAKSVLAEMGNKILPLVNEPTFTKPYREAFITHWPTLQSWCDGSSIQFPALTGLSLFSEQGLLQGLNGSKFRSSQGISSAEKKQHYLADLALDTQAVDMFLEQLNAVSLCFRRSLHEHLEINLAKQLQQLNMLSFDDLIRRLAEVLQGTGAEQLQQAMRRNYKATLIDEFQDTDSQQWFIFSSLFAEKSHFLFLIGDPKQAIYKFRGADIFSYFSAQEQAQQHYTLDKNWRSHPDLVSAVNTLFSHKQAPFLFPQLSFFPVTAALTSAQGALTQAGQTKAPMLVWQLRASDTKNGYWSAGKAAVEIQQAVVNEIVVLLDHNHDFYITQADKPRQNLSAQDIAILVRSNQQAREYQAALRQAGINAVLNSTESVYASPEAGYLTILLQAVAHPGDMRLLKQALTLSWFNIDAVSLLQMSNDESQMDAWQSRFQGYYQRWQKQGLMAMMLSLLEHEGMQKNMAQSVNAERQLTNVHHLLELLQEAVLKEQLGLLKTLDYLHKVITEQSKNEAQQLRLESDQQAVKIVTMHRAKGLEYPVVFCPYLWQRNNRLKHETQLVSCHQAQQMIADLGSENFAERRTLALYEELAEDLRVFYVALTRAKYRCYIAWADVRSNAQRNDSAMDYLLFSEQESTFAAQQDSLKSLCQQQPEAIEYAVLKAEQSDLTVAQTASSSAVLSARQAKRTLSTFWQMSSYTALSALSLSETPELPEDKVQETAATELPDEEEVSLPKGAQTGNVVHDLLENIAFDVLATDVDITQTMTAACLRYGLKLDQAQTAVLQVLLKNTVQTALSAQDPDFCLSLMSDEVCIKEMPFYLSLDAINTQQINAILQGCPAFQPLSGKQMQGYLTGFIDLICEYQGQYYVMDYKTNSLADYQADSLTEAMREHNYGLQYWLYTLVLHHFLQQRLPDYDYATHFGGVRYLFVRGMVPSDPMSGVYQDIPDLQQVLALAQLFGGLF